MKYRALIADDEPLVRLSIQNFLRAIPTFEVAQECGDGRSTIDGIRTHRPDVVFLDVQMPEMDGFAVIDEIGPERMPVTIFVTAYDQYALQAFDANVLDYLLKPFGERRFKKAVSRATGQLECKRNSITPRLAQMLKNIERERQCVERLAVPTRGRFMLLDVCEIDSIEAEGNYARIHAGLRSHVMRTTLNELEKKLSPKHFMRIHRSTIVNIRLIKEIHPWFQGHHVLIMKNGKQLSLSRYQKGALETLLGNKGISSWASHQEK